MAGALILLHWVLDTLLAIGQPGVQADPGPSLAPTTPVAAWGMQQQPLAPGQVTVFDLLSTGHPGHHSLG